MHSFDVKALRRLCTKIRRDGIAQIMAQLQHKFEAERRDRWHRPVNVLY